MDGGELREVKNLMDTDEINIKPAHVEDLLYIPAQLAIKATESRSFRGCYSKSRNSSLYGLPSYSTVLCFSYGKCISDGKNGSPPRSSQGLYCYNRHHDQKQLEEDRVYFCLLLQFIMRGSWGRNSMQEHAEAMEESCLLACSLWLAQPVFLYTRGWALQHQSLIKKMSHKVAYGPMEISSLTQGNSASASKCMQSQKE